MLRPLLMTELVLSRGRKTLSNWCGNFVWSTVNCEWNLILTIQTGLHKVDDAYVFNKFTIVQAAEIVNLQRAIVACEAVALGFVEVQCVALAVVIVATKLHALQVDHWRQLVIWLVEDFLLERRSIVGWQRRDCWRSIAEQLLEMNLKVGTLLYALSITET